MRHCNETILICFLTALSIITSYSCSGKPEKTDPQIIVELEYIVFACGDDCPRWVPIEILKQFPDNENDEWYDAAVNIRPFEDSSQLPDTLGWSGDIIKFEGNYDADHKEFYYSNFKIVDSRHHEATQ